jgi:hypothetical protein
VLYKANKQMLTKHEDTTKITIADFPTKNDEAVKPSEKPKPAPRTKIPNANPFLQSDGAPAIPPKPKNPFLDDMDENETENTSVNPFTKFQEYLDLNRMRKLTITTLGGFPASVFLAV